MKQSVAKEMFVLFVRSMVFFRLATPSGKGFIFSGLIGAVLVT